MLRAKLPEAKKGDARDEAAEKLKVSPRYVSDAKKLKEEEPELFRDVEEGKKTLQDAKREVKERKREGQRQKNTKLVASNPIRAKAGEQYPTIVLDPPWDWGDEGDQDQLGRARPTYNTMTIEELMDETKLPVRALAAENAHIYLWITNRSLPRDFNFSSSGAFVTSPPSPG